MGHIVSIIEQARPITLVLISFFAILMIGFSILHQRYVSAMIRAINDQPGRTRKISSTVWYTGKVFLIKREYRRLFPSGAETRYARSAFLASSASAIILFFLLVSILPKKG